MQGNSRRDFLMSAGAAATAALFAGPAPAAERKMKMCLNTGNIGVRANLAESVAMAEKYGFEAVDPNVGNLAALSDSAMSELLGRLQSGKLVFGSIAQGFPITGNDEKWTAFLAELASTARTLQRARVTRFVTWLSSSDNNLTYLQNFKLHARRISQAADVLGACNVRLGLEYLGPKTAWARGRYPFIHTLATMKELIAETGKKNIGLLLDSWHWYNAGDTPADLLTLRNEDIVAVHINDAPSGVPVDQQVDSRRELPLATGVIDMAGFINAINQVGYDGPVAAEPMSADLRKLPPDEALARTADAVKKTFALLK